MKYPILLLIAAPLAAALGGCGSSSSPDPAVVATAVASSKPNPWSIDSKVPPSEAASASGSTSDSDPPPASDSPSAAAKSNPWGKAGPSDGEAPTVSGNPAEPVK